MKFHLGVMEYSGPTGKGNGIDQKKYPGWHSKSAPRTHWREKELYKRDPWVQRGFILKAYLANLKYQRTCFELKRIGMLLSNW